VTDYAVEVQPSNIQLVVEAYDKEPVIVDYPSSVLNVTVDPNPTAVPVTASRFIFSSPTLKWVVAHNRGTDFVICTAFDANGRQIIARVTKDTLNQLTIHLTEAGTGHVDVLFATKTLYETNHVD
jgi:precorrin-6B methylase 1